MLMRFSQETNDFATLLFTRSSLSDDNALMRRFDHFLRYHLRLVDLKIPSI
jgi:hypothetical protein